MDGEPYVVDGQGFHKEADYVVCSNFFYSISLGGSGAVYGRLTGLAQKGWLCGVW